MDRTNKTGINNSKHQSRDKFREIFNQSPIGIIFHDKKGNAISANNSALEIMAISKLDDILGINLFDNPFIEEKKEKLFNEGIIRFKAPLDLKNIKDFGFYYPTKKGVLFLDYTVSVTDSGYLVQIQDVTERKKSEEELKESEDRYHSLFKNNHAIMLLIDPDNGDIIDANPAATSFYGYSREELKRMKITDINALTEGQVFEEMQKAQVEKKNHFLFKHRLASGEIRYVDTYSGPITVEGKNLLYSIIHDVTKRKKAEKALLKNEEELRQARDNLEEKVKKRTFELEKALDNYSDLYNNAPCGYHSLDKYGYIVKINDTELSWLGYSREEIIGKKKFTDLITKESIKKFQKNFSDFKERGSIYDLEFDMIRKDCSIMPALINATAITDSKGKYIMSRSTLMDITELKKAEKQLKDTIKELERSNRELQSFAYITSHDLQEPLRSIASYAQLIQRRYEGQLDSDADEFIDFMVGGAKRLQSMIQGLLDYSRVGTQGEEFKDFNAEEALNHAISNLQSAISECHAEVSYDSLPVIHADESQISRVFQNLMGNALKFRKEGVQPKIHIKARKEGAEYIFSVQDNGIGIEPQYTDRIFEVFKRLHAIGEYQGSGIGLAIVKRIIERHSGRVWVDSSLGVGSTFYFTLPTD